MALRTIQDSTLTAIADAIRAKTGSTGKMTPADMPDAVAAIQASAADSDIIISSKNLADPSATIPNKYIGGGGAETSYNGWSITSYIPVEPGRFYSVGPMECIKDLQYSGFYNSSKQYLRAVGFGNFDFSRLCMLKVPEGVRYVRFSTSTVSINKCGAYEVIAAGPAEL